MKMAVMKMTPLVVFPIVVIVLCGLCPASSQSWRAFQKKHIDPFVSIGDNNYCNREISNRRITNRGPCKFRNTFIHASPSTIKGLCAGPGRSVTSNNQYLITDCRHRPMNNNEMPPNCNYITQNFNRRIVIVCEDGDPVHLERIIL